jgi:hypothetical protein
LPASKVFAAAIVEVEVYPLHSKSYAVLGTWSSRQPENSLLLWLALIKYGKLTCALTVVVYTVEVEAKEMRIRILNLQLGHNLPELLSAFSMGKKVFLLPIQRVLPFER